MINLRNLCVLSVGVLVATLTSSCFSFLYSNSYRPKKTTTKRVVVHTVLINDSGDVAVTFRGADDEICLLAKGPKVEGLFKDEFPAGKNRKDKAKTRDVQLDFTKVLKGKSQQINKMWRVTTFPPWPPEQSTIIQNSASDGFFKFAYPPGATDKYILLSGTWRETHWRPWLLLPLIITVPLDIITSPIQVPLLIWLEIALDNAGF